MKKIFLAALTSLALCGYSYAQDDDDEYEEEETTEAVKPAPAVEDEEEDEAPAPKVKKEKKKKKAKKSSDGDEGGFLGISIGLDENNIIDFEPNFFVGDFSYVGLMIKFTPEMMLTAKIGFAHYGETTVDYESASVDGGDDFTALAFGAQFDYFLPTPILPTSISAAFMYATTGEMAEADFSVPDPEDAGMDLAAPTSKFSAIMIDIMFNAHANLAQGFVLTGSVGLGIEMPSQENKSTGMVANETTGMPEVKTTTTEYSRTNIGIKAGISLGWFFM